MRSIKLSNKKRYLIRQRWLASLEHKYYMSSEFALFMVNTVLSFPDSGKIKDLVKRSRLEVEEVYDDTGDFRDMYKMLKSILVSESRSANATETETESGPVLISLPRHLIVRLWASSTEDNRCCVCLEKITNVDLLKVIVCCGQSYCTTCFTKLDKCAMCRRIVIDA